jgi:ADP-ribosyl-[dinitrogen reductase] hydrolase
MTDARTSSSSPLRIDSVGVGPGFGLIGMTLCPGKKYISPYTGPWDRDLASDLFAIKAFGATALVTLMEVDELEHAKVPVSALAMETEKLGLESHLLPIRDVSVPDEKFEDLWAYSGARLRSLLRSGKNIVIHCMGGRGRTGTIASRLLVELGQEPDEAIANVRRARRGAVETREQEDYVRAIRRMTADQERLLDRACGCILGGALGDAFGYEIEFCSSDVIRRHFGPKGLLEPVAKNGKLLVSDDTQMTLFTLQGMLRAAKHAGGDQSRIDEIRTAYKDWFATQRDASPQSASTWLGKQPVMYAQRAPGNTCMSALSVGGSGTIAEPINDSKGCGGVMRVAPIGLFTILRSEEAFRLGAAAAALTHGHPSGYLSAGTMATLVRRLIDGTSLTKAVEGSCVILSGYPNYHETLAAIRQALTLVGNRVDHATVIERFGGGWVGEEALAIALYAVLSATSFVEAIQIAANHGGDSDSTASLGGQLWGVQHGLAGMPHGWIKKLDVLQPCLHLLRQATDVIWGGERKPTD